VRNDSVTVQQGAASKVLVPKLLANDSSVFGDALTFDMTEFEPVPKASTRGVLIGSDGSKLWLYYNIDNLKLDTNGYDTFTYSAVDAVGGKGVGTVYVKVSTSNSNYRPNNFKGATQEVGGELTLEFIGLNTRRYRVQGTDNLLNPTWKDLQLIDRNLPANTDLSLIPSYEAAKTNVFNCSNSVIRVTDPAGISAGGQFFRAIVN
jgi:hypothetical protein